MGKRGRPRGSSTTKNRSRGSKRSRGDNRSESQNAGQSNNEDSTPRKGSRKASISRNLPTKSSKLKKPWEVDDESDGGTDRLDFISGSDNDDVVDSDDNGEDSFDSESISTTFSHNNDNQRTAKSEHDEEYAGGDDDASDDDTSDENGSEEADDENDRVPSPVWNVKRCPWVELDDLPPFPLPPSSEDLLISRENVLDALEVYETCRRFSHSLALSPFLFEDFCAALKAMEQSRLLAEMHISILKLLVKEDEDMKQIIFGPLDLKDSINITFHLIDPMTYAEVLRQYVESDGKRVRNEVFEAISNPSYPFVPAETRLIVLKWLVERFLNSHAFRKELKDEGRMEHDTHCRNCGKNGNNSSGHLLKCAGCSAIYHVKCVDPPITNPTILSDPTSSSSSNDDQFTWFCTVCNSHTIRGVSDCIDNCEKRGFSVRQEALGYDRHGRRYWFLVRRIFVLDENTNEVWYYSTLIQLRELVDDMDGNELEWGLVAALESVLAEVESQMQITAELTNQRRLPLGSVASQRLKEKKKNKKTEESNEHKSHDSSLLPADSSSVGEGDSNSAAPDDVMLDQDPKSVKNEVDQDDNQSETGGGLAGQIDAFLNEEQMKSKTYTAGLLGPERTGSERDEGDGAEDAQPKTTGIVISIKSTSAATDSDSKPAVQSSWMPTEDPNRYYKLGQDIVTGYKSFINQFSTNELAKTPYARAQERNRSSYMDRKFSVLDDGEFKWPQIGNMDLFGTCPATIVVLKTMIRRVFLRINPGLYHQRFTKPKRLKYLERCGRANSVKDFQDLLSTMELYLRKLVFSNIWLDHLGHTKLVRLFPDDREERKKIEKIREKALKHLQQVEPDDDPTVIWVKYSPTANSVRPKHGIWKNRDEQYRVNGPNGQLGGWHWISCNRRVKLINPMEQFDLKEKKINRLSGIVDSIGKKNGEGSLLHRAMLMKEARSKCYSKMCQTGQIEHMSTVCYNPSCRERTNKIKEIPESDIFQRYQKAVQTETKSKAESNNDESLPLPSFQDFHIGSSGRLSILVPPRHLLRHAARRPDLEALVKWYWPGFKLDSKASSIVWPYPCARPHMYLTWRFSLQRARSLHAIALQMRILFANINWPSVAPMNQEKGLEAKYTANYDSYVEVRELINHKEIPPHGLCCEYECRIRQIPHGMMGSGGGHSMSMMDTPEQSEDDDDDGDDRQQSEGNDDDEFQGSMIQTPPPSGDLTQRSSRRSLRKSRAISGAIKSKRKVARSLTKPTVKTVWMDENSLKVWEIRNYWDRFERNRNVPPVAVPSAAAANSSFSTKLNIGLMSGDSLKMTVPKDVGRQASNLASYRGPITGVRLINVDPSGVGDHSGMSRSVRVGGVQGFQGNYGLGGMRMKTPGLVSHTYGMKNRKRPIPNQYSPGHVAKRPVNSPAQLLVPGGVGVSSYGFVSQSKPSVNPRQPATLIMTPSTPSFVDNNRNNDNNNYAVANNRANNAVFPMSNSSSSSSSSQPSVVKILPQSSISAGFVVNNPPSSSNIQSDYYYRNNNSSGSYYQQQQQPGRANLNNNSSSAGVVTMMKGAGGRLTTVTHNHPANNTPGVGSSNIILGGGGGTTMATARVISGGGSAANTNIVHLTSHPSTSLSSSNNTTSYIRTIPSLSSSAASSSSVGGNTTTVHLSPAPRIMYHGGPSTSSAPSLSSSTLQPQQPPKLILAGPNGGRVRLIKIVRQPSSSSNQVFLPSRAPGGQANSVSNQGGVQFRPANPQQVIVQTNQAPRNQAVSFIRPATYLPSSQIIMATNQSASASNQIIRSPQMISAPSSSNQPVRYVMAASPLSKLPNPPNP